MNSTNSCCTLFSKQFKRDSTTSKLRTFMMRLHSKRLFLVAAMVIAGFFLHLNVKLSINRFNHPNYHHTSVTSKNTRGFSQTIRTSGTSLILTSNLTPNALRQYPNIESNRINGFNSFQHSYEKSPMKSHECEVFDLGCFAFKKSVPASKMREISSLEECYAACDSGFAAVARGRYCICSANKYIEIRNISSKSCNIACPLQSNKKCGGIHVASLYRVVQCVKVPFPDDFVETRRLGCFHKPLSNAGFKTVEANSLDNCLLKCGSLLEPIAAFDWITCRCGKMTDKFNLTHAAPSCYANATPIYRTLVEDRRCSVQLLPSGTMRITTLSSFPGSGNTWTRYLLEKATGFYTGSVYTDSSLLKSGFLCESQNQLISTNCPIVKDHIFYKRTKFHQTIEVIRNPYDAILANIQRRHKGHTGTVDFDKILSVLDDNLRQGSQRWRNHVERVLMENKPFLIVYYEDLVKDPLKEIEKMVRFLPIGQRPPDLHQRLSCLSQELTGFNKRKKVKFNFDLVSIEVKKLVDATIDDVRLQLARIGIKNPLPNYNKLFSGA